MGQFNGALPGDTWTSCTIIAKTGEFCDGPVPAGSPISACQIHLVQAFRFCEDALDQAADERAHGKPASELSKLRAEQIQLRAETMSAVVYYIRRGEHIKIGTTRNLANRMRLLKPDEVLAVEAGGHDVESRRHAQFAHLRVPGDGELFRQSPDLLQHIGFLQARVAA